MLTVPAAFTLAIPTQLAQSADVSATVDWLHAIDRVIIGLSLALGLALFFALRRAQPGQGLLALPVRRHRLLPTDLVWIATCYFLAAYVCLALLIPEGKDSTASPLGAILSSNVAQLSGGIACLVIVARRFRGGVGPFLLGQGSGTFVPVAVITILAMGWCPLVLAGTVMLITALSPDIILPEHSTLQSLEDTSAPQVQWFLWIGAAVVAPVCEELFFRGILQSFLFRELRRRGLAIVMTAGAFALVHMSVAQTLPALFLMGVLLGVLYERTGSVVSVMAVHALFNIKTLVWHHLVSSGAAG